MGDFQVNRPSIFPRGGRFVFDNKKYERSVVNWGGRCNMIKPSEMKKLVQRNVKSTGQGICLKASGKPQMGFTF